MTALVVSLLLASPAAAQMHDMGHMAMPGMTMPKAAAKPKRTPTPGAKAKPAARNVPTPKAAPPPAACPPEHAAMGHCGASAAAAPAGAPMADMPGMEGMKGMTHDTPVTAAATAAKGAMLAPAGTDQPAGDAPPPAPPTTLAATRFYDPAAMAAADRRMRAEHGGMTFGQILFDLAEVQVRNGRDGLRWDGEGWWGGDVHRLVVKTEGDASIGRRVDDAEVQALYSRAIGPYTDLQGGLRQDLDRGGRTYATIGVEGLAPYWFQFEGALFLSGKGDLLGRVQGYYDQRITQRLILQPRVEFNLAAQDVPRSGIAAGLSSADLGLRLRYEVRREFAPYLGLAWEHRGGAATGGGLALAIGTRAWF